VLQYIVLVLVVFAAQLVGGIVAFVYRDQLTGIVTDGLTATLSQYDGSTTTNMAVTRSWDFIQTTVREKLGCHANQYSLGSTWRATRSFFHL